LFRLSAGWADTLVTNDGAEWAGDITFMESAREYKVIRPGGGSLVFPASIVKEVRKQPEPDATRTASPATLSSKRSPAEALKDYMRSLEANPSTRLLNKLPALGDETSPAAIMADPKLCLNASVVIIGTIELAENYGAGAYSQRREDYYSFDIQWRSADLRRLERAGQVFVPRSIGIGLAKAVAESDRIGRAKLVRLRVSLNRAMWTPLDPILASLEAADFQIFMADIQRWGPWYSEVADLVPHPAKNAIIAGADAASHATVAVPPTDAQVAVAEVTTPAEQQIAEVKDWFARYAQYSVKITKSEQECNRYQQQADEAHRLAQYDEETLHLKQVGICRKEAIGLTGLRNTCEDKIRQYRPEQITAGRNAALADPKIPEEHRRVIFETKIWSDQQQSAQALPNIANTPDLQNAPAAAAGADQTLLHNVSVTISSYLACSIVGDRKLAEADQLELAGQKVKAYEVRNAAIQVLEQSKADLKKLQAMPQDAVSTVVNAGLLSPDISEEMKQRLRKLPH